MILNQPKVGPLSLPRGDAYPPGDIYSGLAAWFNSDAQNVVRDSNNLVSQMTDLSGMKFNATQATASRQPLWIDDFCNGHPVVRFKGENGACSYLATASITASYCYVFLAARFLEYMSGGGVVVAACGNWLYPQQGSTLNWYIGTTDSGAPLTFTSGPTVVEMALAGAQSFVSANTTRGKYISATASSNVVIIGGRSVSYVSGCAMDLAELLVYNQQIDEAQQFRVRKYLGIKYGVDVV